MQLKNIRFDNPMFSLTTTFNREDFTRLLTNDFKVAREAVNGVFRHGPRDEFLRRPVDDDARAVREVLPRPRGRDPPADGADHLRQRQHARRPGDQLRHRLLELHVEGRVHVRRRHRQAHRPDGARARKERRRYLHQGRRHADRLPRAAASAASKSTAARFAPAPCISNANLNATIFNLVGEEYFDQVIRRRSPRRAAEQLQHAGLHGPQAGRADRRIHRRLAVQLHGAAVPHRAAAEPRHHQPHVFVLLPAHAARRPAAVPDRLQHERQLSTTGRT